MIAVKRTGEDNNDAHLKRQVIGREVMVPFTKGRLDVGTCEHISMVNSMAVGQT